MLTHQRPAVAAEARFVRCVRRPDRDVCHQWALPRIHAAPKTYVGPGRRRMDYPRSNVFVQLRPPTHPGRATRDGHFGVFETTRRPPTVPELAPSVPGACLEAASEA